MKWAAAAMRRSAASHRSRAVLVSPAAAAMRASASRANTSTGASSPLPRISEDRHQTLLGPWSLVRGVHGRQQALTERGLLATAGVAVPGGRGFECRPRCRDLSEPTQNPTQVYPGERGQAHIAGGLGLVDRELQGGRPSFVVAGLALRSAETRELVCLGLLEAELVAIVPLRDRGAATASSNRCCSRASSPRIASPRTCSHGSSTSPSQCCTWSAASTLRAWSPAEIAALAANSEFAAWSHGRSSVS